MYPAPQWSTRMKIALDAARGIAFLHAAERPLIYRDLKTSNILLDEVYPLPKIKTRKKKLTTTVFNSFYLGFLLKHLTIKYSYLY